MQIVVIINPNENSRHSLKNLSRDFLQNLYVDIVDIIKILPPVRFRQIPSPTAPTYQFLSVKFT